MFDRIDARLEQIKTEMTAEVAAKVVEEVRKLLAAIDARPPPNVVTKAEACRRLSISLSKLKLMIRAKLLATCQVGDTQMIPASELNRIATPRAPVPPRRSGGRPKKASKHNGRAEGAEVRARLRNR